MVGAVFFLLDSRRREYELEVDDETIRMRRGFFRIDDRRVRRGHVHYLQESNGNMFREAGLRLSEHGRIYIFFLGCVVIPASLPEYQQLKAKAMTWMDIA